MPFCNTHHKCFSTFLLAKNPCAANYHEVIQGGTIQALTCHLKRKESALHFIICRENFLPRKFGNSFQMRKNQEINQPKKTHPNLNPNPTTPKPDKIYRNTIRRLKTYFTPSPLCSPITTCTTILYLLNPTSGEREKIIASNYLFKIGPQNRAHKAKDFYKASVLYKPIHWQSGQTTLQLHLPRYRVP